MNRTLALAALFALAALPASAHTLGAVGATFAHGFVHPLAGLDHVLAMVAVGLWAAQLGGRALGLVPLSFVALMGVGALAGLSGLALPMVEIGIAGSLVVLGLLVGFAARLPVAAGMVLVGALAVFHGHAHGAEAPIASSFALYALGFAVATALLHGLGVGLALGMKRGLLVRLGGAGVAAAGLVLLIG